MSTQKPTYVHPGDRPNTVQLQLPRAWVTEDGVLFISKSVFVTFTLDFANKALAEAGYEQRMTVLDTPITRRHGVRYVDPAYVLAETWPDSAVSTTPVDGWVKLYRLDVEDLAIPTPKSVPAPCTCGVAFGSAEGPCVCEPEADRG